MQMEDLIVEKKVQQRLGEWSPPQLSAEDRAHLEKQREDILAEMAKLEASIEKRRAAERQ